MISIYLRKINIWYLSSLLISIAVAIPIVTVFSSFFDSTVIILILSRIHFFTII